MQSQCAGEGRAEQGMALVPAGIEEVRTSDVAQVVSDTGLDVVAAESSW